MKYRGIAVLAQLALAVAAVLDVGPATGSGRARFRATRASTT